MDSVDADDARRCRAAASIAILLKGLTQKAAQAAHAAIVLLQFEAHSGNETEVLKKLARSNIGGES